jgi:hypothetical protein
MLHESPEKAGISSDIRMTAIVLNSLSFGKQIKGKIAKNFVCLCARRDSKEATMASNALILNDIVYRTALFY